MSNRSSSIRHSETHLPSESSVLSTIQILPCPADPTLSSIPDIHLASLMQSYIHSESHLPRGSSAVLNPHIPLPRRSSVVLNLHSLLPSKSSIVLISDNRLPGRSNVFLNLETHMSRRSSVVLNVDTHIPSRSSVLLLSGEADWILSHHPCLWHLQMCNEKIWKQARKKNGHLD